MERKTYVKEEKEQLLIQVDEGIICDEGITLVLIFSIFIAVSGSFTCGFASGYSSPVQSAILEELHLSTTEYSLFGSMLTVGGLLGALVSGKLSDIIGRRGTMGLSGILNLAGWLAILYSQDSRLLDTGRLALGLASGLITFVVPVYIAEIAPKNVRGGLVLLHQVKATSENVYEAALKRLRGENIDITQEAAEIKEYTGAVQNISTSFFDVFQMKYAYALTVTLGLMALAGFGGTNGILFYASTIFELAGVSGTVGTIAMGLIQLPPTIIGVFLMDKYGRRPILMFSAAGMSTGCFLVALAFLLKAHGWMLAISPSFALIGILIFSATFPVGMGGIPCIIMAEIFPVNIKGAAGSIATVVSCTSSSILCYTFNFMMQWSSYGTFLVFTGVNVISILFVAKLVPETKGRTLEEIQTLIT